MTILYGLDSGEYHAMPDLGNSGISALLESPYHYWSQYCDPSRPDKGASPAMVAGTLAHCVILEPGAFGDRYAVQPDGIDMRTKEGKAWRDALPPGVVSVSRSQHEVALAQMRACSEHVSDVYCMVASKTRTEVSAFWVDASTGIECKCRPDAVHVRATDGRAVLIDLKTARSVSPSAFARAVATYGYHRQAAWYSRGYAAASGVDVAAFIFLVVSSAYPFVAAAYTLDAASMQQGADECDAALSLLSECRRSGDWPAYGRGIQEISLPAYALASTEVEVYYD